jgi:hypothetical protein
MVSAGSKKLHYLESLDSVRAPWPGDGARGPHDVLVLLEVLVVLALGRDLVVPQAYALDSYSFLTVASRILRARDRIRADDHPFRLHLYGVDSYGEAVGAMLGRVGKLERPFFSSLFPELQDPAGHGLDPAVVARQASTLDRLLSSDWIGDERAEGVELIYREFSRRPRAAAHPTRTVVTVEDVLRDVVDERTAVVLEARSHRGRAHREVWQVLRKAITELDPYRRGTFDQRSRLRQTTAWFGDRDGRAAGDVVGGHEQLELVIEFVDTLYNRQITDSIGDIAQATFTTTTAQLDDHKLFRLAIAQDLALGCYSYRSAPGPQTMLRVSGAGPEFQIRTDAVETNDAVHNSIQGLLDSLDDGLGALLEARSHRGVDGRARSRFWRGLDAWEGAAAAGDVKAARRRARSTSNTSLTFLAPSHARACRRAGRETF